VKNYRTERNGARGPGFFSLDMRFGYRFALSQSRRLEIAADLFTSPIERTSGTRRVTWRPPISCC